MKGGRGRGFTLSELLVGLLILGVLVAAAAEYTRLSVSRYRQTGTMMERVQLEATARNAVIQELGFAGYGRGFIGEFSGSTVEVKPGRDADTPDVFRIHYLEERWLDTPQERHITFEVARDGAGTWNLYRREDGATRQPAVQDVTNLKLLGFIDGNGALTMPWTPWPAEVTGIVVQLTFSWGTQRATYIPFISAQKLGWL